MRASMAFFAGVGTVIVAVAAGLGGGLMMANMMSSQAPYQLGKAERHGASETSASSKDPLVPVPYMAATQASSNGPVVVSTAAQNAEPARNESNVSSAQGTPAPAQTPDATASNDHVATTPASGKSGAAKVAETAQSSDTLKSSEVSKSTELSTTKPAASAVQTAVAQDQPASADNAYAKARNADVKQAERRRADRRQQWADRRRYQPSRDQELRDVEASVREATDTRSVADSPTRIGYPQVRVFEAE
jgi:hypothetical protein